MSTPTINIGDTIRKTVTFPSGDTIVRTFKVARIDGTWFEGVDVGTPIDNYVSDVYTATVEVIARFVPPEPTELGSLVTFDRKRSTSLTVMRVPQGEAGRKWVVVGVDGKPRNAGWNNFWGWTDVLNQGSNITVTRTGYLP